MRKKFDVSKLVKKNEQKKLLKESKKATKVSECADQIELIKGLL